MQKIIHTLFLPTIFIFGNFFPLIVINFIRYFIPKQQIIQYDRYCNFSKDLYRGSTNRDVLFLVADSFRPGLELAIKTLRSTGCQCRILIFSSKIYIPDRVMNIFNRLNVEIILNSTNVPGRTISPHMNRYEYEREWLQNHINEVDRVFHADAFDVLFQKDPFSPEIKNDRLLFVVEPHLFQSCGWNIAWFKQCFNSSTFSKVKDKYIICSGSIIGGAIPYLQFLEIMISLPEWKSCYGSSLDQPIVNYLVWLNVLKDHDIKYNFTGCDGNFLTIQWCQLDKKIPLNQHQQIQSLGGSIPAFVHQYNRIESLATMFYGICNVPPPPVKFKGNP